ncbi:MAG: PH domain-containing protein [Lachnospiraceae bacterium]|nr:PH domain-containing protein [Lachnospiraceae bacterium]
MYKSDLEAMVGMNESILWRGKPDKKCFILESIFNPMLPFALIWAIVDLAVVGITFSAAGGMLMFILPFMLLHLMPVWIYIGGVIMSFRKHRNTQYIITDKGIYVSGGIFAYRYEMKPFTDLSHINIHRGIFDQWLGVGDVVTVCSHTGYSSNSSHSHSHSSNGLTICDIPDYQQVFAMIKQLQTDIYADTQFPNDLRPGENHGYQTQYRGRN